MTAATPRACPQPAPGAGGMAPTSWQLGMARQGAVADYVRRKCERGREKSKMDEPASGWAAAAAGGCASGKTKTRQTNPLCRVGLGVYRADAGPGGSSPPPSPLPHSALRGFLGEGGRARESVSHHQRKRKKGKAQARAKFSRTAPHCTPPPPLFFPNSTRLSQRQQRRLAGPTSWK